MEYSGTNLKNPKKILGQTLKSQAKKELFSPCIPIFKNCNYKKSHMNKKTHILLVYQYLKNCNYKKEP